ncbi:VWA-like domain-containing protein [Clostridium sp. SYSU_GA19001]|uniref:vWA domain-containing protein n=1 Tax=Clostridium caldaquaticum TaxID=2940653 RepID=UPI0020774383|nr:VWA-like domain-containing protein [Clostridium caldaquaticum]MCM8711467.1 VWA-like domain-containing protein [Clostridium caldaquaticum]
MFEKLRGELLAEVSILDENARITEEFKKKFFKLIEICALSMMNKDDNFFAFFFIQMKREIKIDLPSATGTRITNQGYVIYFNPLVVLDCSRLELEALIKHEIYHIMSGHHTRARVLKNMYSDLAVNIAMDISVNQYILNLPLWSYNIENVKRSYDVDLKEEQTMEQYAAAIQAALNKRKRVKDTEEGLNNFDENLIKENSHIFNTHDIWDTDEELDGAMIKEMTKKMALSALKGKIPESIDELIRELNRKAEISWKDYLKKLLGSLPYGYKKVITRKDRRQPDRLDLRGRLSKHIAQIVVAIDISGSISDKQIENIMTEIFSIVKNYPSEITILECDSEVRRVYKVKDKKGIKKKLNTRGSTKFSPVIYYMSQKRMRNHILIYFTDGLGEEELSLVPVHKRTIWVLTGKNEELSLKRPYGVIKKLSNVKAAEPTLDYAPDAIKEYRMLEWQQSS